MICIAKDELVYNDLYFQRIRVNCDLMNAGLNWDICVAPPSTNTMLTMSFPMWRLRSTCSNWQDDNHYNMIITYGLVALVCIVFVYYIIYKTKNRKKININIIYIYIYFILFSCVFPSYSFSCPGYVYLLSVVLRVRQHCGYMKHNFMPFVNGVHRIFARHVTYT